MATSYTTEQEKKKESSKVLRVTDHKPWGKKAGSEPEKKGLLVPTCNFSAWEKRSFAKKNGKKKPSMGGNAGEPWLVPLVERPI